MTRRVLLDGACRAVLATLVVILAGCATPRPDQPAAAPGGPPRPGGTLKVAVSSDQGCLDPQQVTSNDTVYSARQLVDSLTDQDPASGRITPWLASSWQVNPDATAYTFFLRPGVTFSDGSPLTAQVVKDNLDAIPGLGARATLAKGYLAGYAGSTVTGPDRITVRFHAPNVQFLQASSTHSLGILAPATLALTEDQRCRRVVGSGPFTLGDYVRNQSITLLRRPDYRWGSSLWAHSGPAYLDRVEVHVVAESGERTGSLQAGEMDLIGSVGQQDEVPLTTAGDRLLPRTNPGLPFGINLNLARPVVSDSAVREALSLAVNRDEVVSTVFTSGTRAATGVLSSTTPGYVRADPPLTFDADRARRILDAAGWRPGPDGIRVRSGRPLRFGVTFAANAATNQPALELIQQQVRAVGIELLIVQVPIANVTGVQVRGDFDGLWSNLTRADPDILRSYYSTHAANYLRLPPGPADEALAQQAAATDPAIRTAEVARAQRALLDERAVVPVVELSTELAASPTIGGLRFDASSRITLSDTWKGSSD